MKVWMLMPTCNPQKARLAVNKWHDRGYHVAIAVDAKDLSWSSCQPDLIHELDNYEGYWHAINSLVMRFSNHPIYVAAADDLNPDPNKTAQQIAAEYQERFPDGFGLMQPCGDRQGIDHTKLPAAARICGSPWFGRGWVERAYQGNGPMPQSYWHFYGDEELKEVSEKLGVLWMRENLCQFHEHWAWGHGKREVYQARNSSEHWSRDKATFTKRKEEGYPGHEPKSA